MELLTTAGVALPSRRGTIRLAVGASAVVHAAMAVVVLLLPMRATTLDTSIEITVDVADLLSPPLAPSEVVFPEVESRAPARRRPAARPTAPAPTEQPSEPPPAAAAATPVTPPPEAAVAPEPPASSAATGTLAVAGGGASPAAGRNLTVASSGVSRAGAGSKADAGVAGGEARRRATVDRYRAEVLRTRIREVFRYPSEARELELAGRVLMSVSINRDGRLLDVRPAGRCPHAILCADGLRTIRAAAPFPPVPVELGSSIVVEVPLTYAFE